MRIKLSSKLLDLMPITWLVLLLGLFVFSSAVFAQNIVTQDDVDEVASRMYCPICENEPLDACYNPTCIQWKDEIAKQLREGRSPDEIIAYFVATYGEHVVGVPQNPALRALSFAAPILATILGLLAAFVIMLRWRGESTSKAKLQTENPSSNDDNYRSQIERDVS